jgi:hypothetical protein
MYFPKLDFEQCTEKCLYGNVRNLSFLHTLLTKLSVPGALKPCALTERTAEGRQEAFPVERHPSLSCVDSLMIVHSKDKTGTHIWKTGPGWLAVSCLLRTDGALESPRDINLRERNKGMT